MNNSPKQVLANFEPDFNQLNRAGKRYNGIEELLTDLKGTHQCYQNLEASVNNELEKFEPLNKSQNKRYDHYFNEKLKIWQRNGMREFDHERQKKDY